jgi:uncharacterized protein
MPRFCRFKWFGLFLANCLIWVGAQAATPGKIRVLLITGGHDYETEPFRQVFASFTNLVVQHVTQPKAQEYFRPEAARAYDVIVLYDMWQDISPEAKTHFTRLLREGKGLVATHHCLAGYQDWDEYARIIGGKYHEKKYVVNGVEQPASTYQHDVDFRVHVEDPAHPVTQGVKDFDIHDETYGGFTVAPGVKPLLTTTEPTNGKTLSWTHSYGKARVVYLQLGHDHVAYENPNYRRLLLQAIQWAAVPETEH